MWKRLATWIAKTLGRAAVQHVADRVAPKKPAE
jgi:hypothetical protein